DGTARTDLRRFRHDETARPRPRTGNLEKDRRAARRPDFGGQRSWQGDDVRPRVPANGGQTHARRWLRDRVLQGSTRFYWVLQGSFGFYQVRRVLPGFTTVYGVRGVKGEAQCSGNW